MEKSMVAPADRASSRRDFASAAGALLESLGRHDEGTRLHSGSVAAWSRRIALHLQLPDAHVTFIERCAVLHDIGKLLTPTTILTKPGSLSPEEWARMRSHASEGADMLAGIPELSEYANVVRAHHERPDGRGYPHGLAGTAIPFESRIVSVADSFDAMISRRSYREPLSPTAAIQEIARCSGSQFDTEIVEIFVALVAVPARIRYRRLSAVS